MRYATWVLNFDDNPQEGTTPELEIADLGLKAEGVFYTTPTKIVGYITGTGALTGLEKWQVQEITQEAFLTLAKEKNSTLSLNEEGRLNPVEPGKP